MKKLSSVLFLTSWTALMGCEIEFPQGVDPSAPYVRFVAPSAGDHVTSPLHIQLMAGNFEIEQPGISRDGAGYFVVVIDEPCVAEGELIPFDPPYFHMQDAATEGTLSLEPGTVKLCLQAANGVHVALPFKHEIIVHVRGE